MMAQHLDSNTRVVDLDEIPDSWLQSATVLAIVCICGVGQQMEDSLSAFQIKWKMKKKNKELYTPAK